MVSILNKPIEDNKEGNRGIVKPLEEEEKVDVEAASPLKKDFQHSYSKTKDDIVVLSSASDIETGVNDPTTSIPIITSSSANTAATYPASTQNQSSMQPGVAPPSPSSTFITIAPKKKPKPVISGLTSSAAAVQAPQLLTQQQLQSLSTPLPPGVSAMSSLPASQGKMFNRHGYPINENDSNDIDNIPPSIEGIAVEKLEYIPLALAETTLLQVSNSIVMITIRLR